MKIPRVIYRTFQTTSIPWIARCHGWIIRARNPRYRLEFFDDAAVASFLAEEFPPRYLAAFRKLRVGAGKADLFRYAPLYKRGGVYLDLDAMIHVNLDDLIQPDDEAVLSMEQNACPDTGHPLFLQWALMYAPGHPFLERALEMVLDNVENSRFPHDLHRATGPTLYTKAVRESLQADPDLPHRIVGVDYDGGLSCAWFLKSRLKKRMDRTSPGWVEFEKRSPIYHTCET